MKSLSVGFLGVIFLSLLLVPAVQAHVPVTAADNEALETATFIHDPLKSWAVYGELRTGGVANYYRVEMEQGQRLHLLLFTPEEDVFNPRLVVMGPGIESQGSVPAAAIEVPGGAGVMVIAGERAEQASYEPFTPASYYELVDIDINVNASGTYYVAVYEPSQGGSYGLALGYQEEFGVTEWIQVPLDTIAIHQWEGQSLGFILAPLLGTVAAGFLVLFMRKKTGAFVLQSLFGWLGSCAGLLYLGGGAITLTQMVIALRRTTLTPSVMLTLVFVLLPVIAGIALVRVATHTHDSVAPKTRVKMAVLGFVGLFIWAGLVIGPALAIVTSIVPSAKK